MRLGALLTPGDGANPRHLVEEAQAFESAGFSSIWSAQAMGRGFMMIDPFVALAQAAAVTESVELGTAVLQLTHYNPTDIAIKAFSLKQISADRFLLGVGAGSTAADFQLHRGNYENRFADFEEKLEQLRSTLTDGHVGEGSVSPPPSAAGGPPVFFGTWGKNVVRAATEFDGWIASGMHRSPAECAEALAGYRSAGGKRAIVSTIQVVPGTDFGKLKDDLESYRDAGFDDAVVMMIGVEMDQVRKLI